MTAKLQNRFSQKHWCKAVGTFAGKMWGDWSCVKNHVSSSVVQYAIFSTCSIAYVAWYYLMPVVRCHYRSGMLSRYQYPLPVPRLFNGIYLSHLYLSILYLCSLQFYRFTDITMLRGWRVVVNFANPFITEHMYIIYSILIFVAPPTFSRASSCE